MEFPLIKKLGLDVVSSANYGDFVLAEALESLLSGLPEVYGIHLDGYKNYSTIKIGDNQYTAKLILIEEIKPKGCEHNPCVVHDKINDDKVFKDRQWQCDKCGVKLNMKWEAVNHEPSAEDK